MPDDIAFTKRKRDQRLPLNAAKNRDRSSNRRTRERACLFSGKRLALPLAKQLALHFRNEMNVRTLALKTRTTDPSESRVPSRVRATKRFAYQSTFTSGHGERKRTPRKWKQ